MFIAVSMIALNSLYSDIHHLKEHHLTAKSSFHKYPRKPAQAAAGSAPCDVSSQFTALSLPRSLTLQSGRQLDLAFQTRCFNINS